jgi:hypothetical protein
MIPAKKNQKWNKKHLLLLALLTAICYWPFTFVIFSAKNDNIVHFLPVRFHVSEALRHLHLPLWTPYMYLGYPLHGDMQGGAWNPFVWLISLFGRYNLSSLHIEVLIAIFLAGAGMYRLLSIRNFSASVKLTGALAYLMCGYITDVGGSNISFLWAASYIPFAIAYYYESLSNPTLKNYLKVSIALTLLFLSAYPAFFILTAYALLAGFLIVALKQVSRRNFHFLKQLLIYNFLLLVVFLCLASPAIISFAMILPHYSRGKGVGLSDVFVNSFTPSCVQSFIFPTSSITNKNAGTDLIARNGYFNIFYLLFACSHLFKKKTLFDYSILFGILFFFLFSLGISSPVRQICYEWLPLMNTFRHPSNVRIFVIIGGILSGGIMFDLFEKGENKQTITYLVYGLLAFCTLAILISSANLSFSENWNNVVLSTDKRNGLKDFLDSLTWQNSVFINGTIQLLFACSFLGCVRRNSKPKYAIPLLLIANSFFLAQMSIPFTFSSKQPPKVINAILDHFPNGFPIPDQRTSIKINSQDMLSNFEKIGFNGFYNKRITNTQLIYTPTYFLNLAKLNRNDAVLSAVQASPYAYFAQTISPPNQEPSSLRHVFMDTLTLSKTSNSIIPQFNLKAIWNNCFVFETQSKSESVLCLEQVYLPGWKCFIDEKETEISQANIAFMAVKIPEGSHEVKFLYNPPGILLTVFLSVVTLIVVIFLLLKPIHKEHA